MIGKWTTQLGLIVAAIILFATAFILGGRYTAHGERGMLFVLDRFTGSVRVCRQEKCKLVPNEVVDERPSLSSSTQPQQWSGTFAKPAPTQSAPEQQWPGTQVSPPPSAQAEQPPWTKPPPKQTTGPPP
jgi:hypothetical protein